MTIDETREILAVLKQAYPGSYKGMSDEDTRMTVKLWQESFKNDTHESVRTAIQTLIENRLDRFAPTIAEVKAEVRAITANSYRAGPEELEMLHNLEKKWQKREAEERAAGIDWCETWMRDPDEITRLEQEGKLRHDIPI